VFVVEAESEAHRAAAFVGHNTDRLRMAPITVYNALLAAGDPDAQDVANVCRRAGVRIRNLNNASIVAEGDTPAIGTVRTLIKRRGVRKARATLEALVKGRLAPISSHEINAADKLLNELRPACTVEALAAIILAGGEEAFLTARVAATRQKQPVRDVLAAAWLAALDRKAAK
jgi:hypothetical protein